MVNAYLSLGSNLGNRVENIRSAVKLLAEHSGIRIEAESSFYETAPVGLIDQPDFINSVIEIATSLSPRELLDAALDVETKLGRVRNIRWGPRVIDIDLLLYDDVAMESDDLTIPHPRMDERAFVLVPLAEIQPGLRLADGRTALEAAKALRDQRIVRLAGVT